MESNIRYINERDRFKISAISSVLICMAAHGYAYFNATLRNDRTLWFPDLDDGIASMADNFGTMYASWFGGGVSEKWFLNIVRHLLHWGYLPWLSGLWTMVFIALSVYIVTEVLDINNSVSIILVAGYFSIDSTVIGAHFYDPYTFMAALFFSCMSVFIWSKKQISLGIRVFGEMLFVCLSLATYGAYSSVGPTIVILISLVLLINGDDVIRVLKYGIEYIVSFAGGGVLFYGILQLILYCSGLNLQEYGGEAALSGGGISFGVLIDNVIVAYSNVFEWLYKGRGIMPRTMAMINLICGILLLFIYIYSRNKASKSKKQLGVRAVLIIILIIILPLSIGLIYVISFNNAHYLMTFTGVMVYIGIISLCDRLLPNIKLIRSYLAKLIEKSLMSKLAVAISVVFTCVSLAYIYRGILVSNMAYIRLENLYIISNNMANRVVDHIESCDDFEGNEQIIFYGYFINNEYLAKSQYQESDVLDLLEPFYYVSSVHASSMTHPVNLPDIIYSNTDFNLDIQYYVPENNYFSSSEEEEVQEMNIFPADGSIKKVGDKIVVKFSDKYGW